MNVRYAARGVMGAIGICLWLPLSVAAEPSLFIGGQPIPLGPVVSSGLRASQDGSSAPQLPAASGAGKTATVFRDVPSISGSYSVGGTTVMPYVGAGFNSGYPTDLDRSLHTGPQTPTDTNLRTLFGQSLAPSEFQMGLRIPF